MVEIKEFPITFEEAYKRDNLRENGVGRDILYSQWLAWLMFKGRRVYTPDSSKPPAVIFDVDGTLADMDGLRGPFEWSKVGGDIPRPLIVGMANAYYEQGYEIIVLSGRDSVCYDETYEWLVRFDVPFASLYMRAEGDSRKDSEIKEELFWTDEIQKFNIVACVDDRPQMIRLWHELQIPTVIAVANPYIEF